MDSRARSWKRIDEIGEAIHFPRKVEQTMIQGDRVIVVLPAYNAAMTLERTLAEVSPGVVDEFLLVDDASHDDTVKLAQRLRIPSIAHPKNRGYGGNQKTCYAEALRRGADMVIMLHPDYHYSPKLVGALAWQIASSEFDLVLGSCILGAGALKGGMPVYKYIANRFLTAVENLLLGVKLSEYHAGYRAYNRRVLETLPLSETSGDSSIAGCSSRKGDTWKAPLFPPPSTRSPAQVGERIRELH